MGIYTYAYLYTYIRLCTYIQLVYECKKFLLIHYINYLRKFIILIHKFKKIYLRKLTNVSIG